MAKRLSDKQLNTPSARAKVLKNRLGFRENEPFQINDSFVPWSRNEGVHVHTMQELYNLVKNDKTVDIEGSALAVSLSEGKIVRTPINKKSFIEAIERNEKAKFSLREAADPFLTDNDMSISGGMLVGQDYVPMLGGPFHKQLYIYDYLRMHGYSFYAVNHWPIAKAIIDITCSFTLGRGYRVDCENKQALMLWRLFEEANNLPEMISYLCREISTYGESLIWWLPDQASRITYQLSGNQKTPQGIIPRVRLIDPSCIWDICTFPEDQSRVLFYQWMSPTQYQIFTGQSDGGSVPGSKFIMQQIPGNEIMHFKLNCMSNEKRGRSDLYPVLGFMKRLHDSVNYSVIGMQKASAWSIDTTIEGNDTDLDNYIADQQSQGTIPPAGSEFVHTSKIKREYLGNQGARGADSSAFDWCMSMIAAGVGIPTSYFGTHMSGGQTRASALVGTEPVTKKFQMRQQKIEYILKALAKRLFEQYGIQAEIEVTMPELLTQDRTAKLKDLALAQAEGWMSRERAATIGSKEFQITEFDYNEELKKIQDEGQAELPPISQAGMISTPPKGAPAEEEPQGISGQDRSDIKDEDTSL